MLSKGLKGITSLFYNVIQDKTDQKICILEKLVEEVFLLLGHIMKFKTDKLHILSIWFKQITMTMVYISITLYVVLCYPVPNTAKF